MQLVHLVTIVRTADDLELRAGLVGPDMTDQVPDRHIFEHACGGQADSLPPPPARGDLFGQGRPVVLFVADQRDVPGGSDAPQGDRRVGTGEARTDDGDMARLGTTEFGQWGHTPSLVPNARSVNHQD